MCRLHELGNNTKLVNMVMNAIKKHWVGLCNIIGIPVYCNIFVSNTYCNTFFQKPVRVQYFLLLLFSLEVYYIE